ncbi:MAG: hypothetical protein NWP91_06010 [Rickettsiaceae bacterium]|nr:hypothetical protein [Rickettsiaceae bacterium]
MTNKTNQTEQDNNKFSLETIICKSITCSLKTQYNWSLILLTALMWAFTGGLFPYSTNQNFDMTTTVFSYVQYLSVAIIIYGLIGSMADAPFSKRMLRLGIVTYLLALFTIISTRNFGIMFTVGIWVIKPLAIYSFLLIVQTLWQIPDKISNVQEDTAKIEEEAENSSSKKSTAKRAGKKK